MTKSTTARMSKEKYLDKVITWVEKRKISSIKTAFETEGYESPKIFTNQATKEQVQPDVSFTIDNATHYSEIALKCDDTRRLVTRWKLLSTMASIKKGQLHLFAPKGHKIFTKKLVEDNNIDALIHSL